ncbi:MAG: diguanylate cyclase [Anaerolineaceae bacterium]|jgi:diguanylate cyclase (GGDEF)-like protein|nr:diguanylate cyclase [Anaerolineaceae bacterium]
MQLKKRIIQLTGLLAALLGVAGGVNLWFMQSKMRQAALLGAEQNASARLQIQIQDALTQSRLWFWIYCAVWVIISMLLLVLMNRLCTDIAKRMDAINKMADMFGAGHFAARLHDDGDDELGALARKMNGAALYLSKTRQDLERATRELSVQLEERRAVEARLAEAATHDSLTGLPNRVSFFEQFNHALALAERNNESVALLFLDMDGLKIVNDAFGHDGGDILIRQVGSRLRANIRKSDYVARLAGDEFVVILENLGDIGKDVSLVCEKILKAVAVPYNIRGRRIKLTASIGVSLFPAHGSCATDLLHKADSAMYQVKNGGKNNYAMYEMAIEG